MLQVAELKIRNPKRLTDRNTKRIHSFPYYAGYAEGFAIDVLEEFCDEKSIVFDPWNGSGTTTTIAHRLGISSIGVDLNPVMGVVAKARLGNSKDLNEAIKFWEKIDVSNFDILSGCEIDPLNNWFGPMSSAVLRKSVDFLINQSDQRYINDVRKVSLCVDGLDTHKALLLVAIFIFAKKIIKGQLTSNPTWNKFPALNRKYRINRKLWWEGIKTELATMALYAQENDVARGVVEVFCQNSQAIEIEDASVDMILTSPPYCTRIDYAISTLFELSILGLDRGGIAELRHELLGTTAIKRNAFYSNDIFGPICQDILNFIKGHSSAGSASYYYKNIYQYFYSLYFSLAELSRVLKSNGVAALVLQPSYYKERKIELPLIVQEMCGSLGLVLESRIEFSPVRSIVNINTRSLKYRENSHCSEELLIFKKVSLIR